MRSLQGYSPAVRLLSEGTTGQTRPSVSTEPWGVEEELASTQQAGLERRKAQWALRCPGSLGLSRGGVAVLQTQHTPMCKVVKTSSPFFKKSQKLADFPAITESQASS